jgi:hypothetical protein
MKKSMYNLVFGHESVRNLLAKYVLIYPFLMLIGIFDFVLGTLSSYKYGDKRLPNKNAVLTKVVHKQDSMTAYKSVFECDLNISNEDNIYGEFVKSVQNYSRFNTLGVR